MLELRDVRLRRGAAVLFDRANMTIFRGDKIGIVGRNGCGKSSLLSLLRGDLGPDAGDYAVPGKLNFVSVSQELPKTDATVLEYVRGGDTRLMDIEAELEKARAADDGMQEAHLLGDYDLAGGYTSASRAAEVASGLGMSPEDVERPVKVLSGGLQMRANMARALMSRADVLMLDEPTNHLDLDAVLWLEGWLQRFPGTLLLVSHDREFLDDIVGRIVNIENGQLTHWTGNYTDFQRQHAASVQLSAALAARQAREVARLHSFIERFRAKASKARQVQSRIKALNKLETITTYQEIETFEWLRRAYRHRGRESLREPGRAHRHPRAQRGRQVHAHETPFGRVAAVGWRPGCLSGSDRRQFRAARGRPAGLARHGAGGADTAYR
jgi:ATP-binding cassette, subfamily F, member 3